MKVPRQADLACGNWGVIGDKAGKATFVEVCSEKGAKLLSEAQAKGAVEVAPADPKGIEMRGKVEKAMLKLGDEWREKDFASLGKGKDRLKLPWRKHPSVSSVMPVWKLSHLLLC
jgi:formate dehydrogenase subunit beta